MTTSGAWVQGRIDKGLCRCRKPLAPGKKRCKKCLRKLAREARERNARYLHEGRCRYCPEPVMKDGYCCVAHKKKVDAVNPIYAAAFHRRRRSAGKCVSCRRPSPITQACPRCTRRHSKKSKQRYADNRAKGLCGCGQALTGKYKMCARCRKRARDDYQKKCAKALLAEGQ